MGDANLIRTLGDYFKPSHEGYRNTIELPIGNNVSEDLNQHLKDFLKLVDSLDLNGENRERTRLRLFQFSLHDQARNWLEHHMGGSYYSFPCLILSTGKDCKTSQRYLDVPTTSKRIFLRSWTRFKDLLQKVPHHGIDLWLQIPTTSTTITDTAPTPKNSSSQATKFPNTSQDVDELETQQQHSLNAMLDGNTFVNPFATPSTSAAESSSS
ncbi:hypothetical protein Tco_0178170 [Tanacetum coccineum]